MRFLTSGFLKIKSASAGPLIHLQICLEYKVNIMDSAEQSDFCLEATRKSICFQFFYTLVQLRWTRFCRLYSLMAYFIFHTMSQCGAYMIFLNGFRICR